MNPGFPLRVRLHGGRHTHAARTVRGDEGDHRETACDRWLDLDAINDWRPETAGVSCPACVRAITRGGAA